MNRHFFFIWFVCISQVALAQFDLDDEAGTTDTFYRPMPLHGADHEFTYDHASTVAEGYLRGMAALIHSQGNYLVNERQAAILDQHATRLKLLNDYCRAQWNDWKRERRERKVVAKRQVNLATRAQRYRDAYELTDLELDRAEGKIHWPASLQGPQFELHRKQLEELFRRQAGYDRPTPGDAKRIERECERLIRAACRAQPATNSSESRTAHRFLLGLKYEPLFRAQVF
jgi:hypothetical protein